MVQVLLELVLIYLLMLFLKMHILKYQILLAVIILLSIRLNLVQEKSMMLLKYREDCLKLILMVT